MTLRIVERFILLLNSLLTAPNAGTVQTSGPQRPETFYYSQVGRPDLDGDMDQGSLTSLKKEKKRKKKTDSFTIEVLNRLMRRKPWFSLVMEVICFLWLPCGSRF